MTRYNLQLRRKVLSLDLSPSNGVGVLTRSSFGDPVSAAAAAVPAGVVMVIGVGGNMGFRWVAVDGLGRSMLISSILGDCSSVSDSATDCPRAS